MNYKFFWMETLIKCSVFFSGDLLCVSPTDELNTLLPVLQIYACEESNQHSGALVFLLGQLLSSIPFLFLISISSSLIFYFLIGLRDEFSLLMYFVLNFFMCLLVNEGLVLVVASIWKDIFWSILTLVSIHVSHLFYSSPTLFYSGI